MKKIVALIVLAAVGWFVVQTQPGFLPSFLKNKSSEVADDTEIDSPRQRKKSADEEVETRQQPDQLDLFAQSNETFRWSLDIENGNDNGTLYELNTERDFRSRYNLDTANQQHQDWFGGGGSWRWNWEYKDWVENFYSGRGVVGDGWAATAREIIGSNPNIESVRYVNVLGRVISSEWAKSNSVRKIDSNDLLSWSSYQAAEALPEFAQAIFDKLSR